MSTNQTSAIQTAKSVILFAAASVNFFVAATLPYVLWRALVQPLVPEIVSQWDRGDPRLMLPLTSICITVPVLLAAALCAKDAK